MERVAGRPRLGSGGSCGEVKDSVSAGRESEVVAGWNWKVDNPTADIFEVYFDRFRGGRRGTPGGRLAGRRCSFARARCRWPGFTILCGLISLTRLGRSRFLFVRFRSKW